MYKLVGTLLLIVLGLTPAALAQDDITPTPAPSKTPTSLPEEQAGDGTGQMPVFEPWTQADFSIVTGNVQRPNGIVWYNNNLYAACNGDSTIYEVNDRTGQTRTYIFGVRNAHTLHAEQDEFGELVLWVPDFQTNQLLRITRLGVETVNEELSGPWGIAYLDENEFLVSNLQAGSIVAINRTGETREIVTGLRSPTGVVIDDENVYVANTGSARRAIEWMNLEDALNADQTPEVQPLVSGLQNVTGMVLAPDGYLYFAYALGTRGVVGRVNPQTCVADVGCTNDQVEIVVFTELAAPLAGLTISPDMRLFVHTMFSPDIYWVQLDRPGDNGS